MNLYGFFGDLFRDLFSWLCLIDLVDFSNSTSCEIWCDVLLPPEPVNQPWYAEVQEQRFALIGLILNIPKKIFMSTIAFYAHTHKCGGSSVQLILRDPRVFTVQISDIEISDEGFHSLFLKQVNRPLIIHGHISRLGCDQQKVTPVIYRKFMRALYEQTPMIFPTRHPADLVQSWMHYSKMRANRILADMKSGGKTEAKISGKNYGMINRIAHLNQNDLRLEEGQFIFRNLKINLLEEHEEENMHLFIDHLLGASSDKWILRSMQSQLMAPVISLIAEKVNQGLPYTIIPPQSDDIRPIFYYDSQNITDRIAKKLDQYTFHGYSDRLRILRRNQSADKPTLLASSIKSVDQRLKRIIPGEYSIYEMALAS